MSAETFTAAHGTCIRGEDWYGVNDPMVQSLVIAFAMIVRREILNSCSQGAFSEQNEPVQTAFLSTAHESLGVGVGMSPQMRRMATLKVDVSE